MINIIIHRVADGLRIVATSYGVGWSNEHHQSITELAMPDYGATELRAVLALALEALLEDVLATEPGRRPLPRL
jgi:hypothetical protein